MSCESERPIFFEYKGKVYPDYIRRGHANAFIEPFAMQFCLGEGLDIGGFSDWTFPGATPINILNSDEWDAYHLPAERYDYIFSSHTLEHLPNYVKALEYWRYHLKLGGILFLYLPHPDMEYWLPQNNQKHLHRFTPQQMGKLLRDLAFDSVFVTERDLYWSFAVVGALAK